MTPWNPENADPNQGVGARHHILPKFLIENFADRGRVWVRQRSASVAPGLRTPKDLAVKDFYTFVHVNGHADGRLEQQLSQIESRAAASLKRITDPSEWGRPFTYLEYGDIVMLVACQRVRGMRERRKIELLTDATTRIMAVPQPAPGRKLTPAQRATRNELRDLVIIPTPEAHLGQLLPLTKATAKHLALRPLTVVELTAGAFLTCDEPVTLLFPDDWRPTPMLPPRQRVRSRRRDGVRVPRTRSEIIHVQNTQGGLEEAAEIVMPIGPRTALVFGAINGTEPTHERLDEQESLHAAAELNALLRGQAHFFALCRPDDRDLLDDELPAIGPLLRIGGVTPDQARVAASATPYLKPMLHRHRKP
ncbi:DUF4238 domain-containing protein [Embleya sp. NBC_00896]|uniref:DUF4238 domain-containing protein n=1 Tax=Embleya sp. NBC_00896 TaxID=2975961 RepID=UPI002F90B4D9|nr:DUF4238 domain-containing protein [Embleya sp. NBC_00896]